MDITSDEGIKSLELRSSEIFKTNVEMRKKIEAEYGNYLHQLYILEQHQLLFQETMNWISQHTKTKMELEQIMSSNGRKRRGNLSFSDGEAELLSEADMCYPILLTYLSEILERFHETNKILINDIHQISEMSHDLQSHVKNIDSKYFNTDDFLASVRQVDMTSSSILNKKNELKDILKALSVENEINSHNTSKRLRPPRNTSNSANNSTSNTHNNHHNNDSNSRNKKSNKGKGKPVESQAQSPESIEDFDNNEEQDFLQEVKNPKYHSDAKSSSQMVCQEGRDEVNSEWEEEGRKGDLVDVDQIGRILSLSSSFTLTTDHPSQESAPHHSAHNVDAMAPAETEAEFHSQPLSVNSDQDFLLEGEKISDAQDRRQCDGDRERQRQGRMEIGSGFSCSDQWMQNMLIHSSNTSSKNSSSSSSSSSNTNNLRTDHRGGFFTEEEKVNRNVINIDDDDDDEMNKNNSSDNYENNPDEVSHRQDRSFVSMKSLMDRKQADRIIESDHLKTTKMSVSSPSRGVLGELQRTSLSDEQQMELEKCMREKQEERNPFIMQTYPTRDRRLLDSGHDEAFSSRFDHRSSREIVRDDSEGSFLRRLDSILPPRNRSEEVVEVGDEGDMDEVEDIRGHYSRSDKPMEEGYKATTPMSIESTRKPISSISAFYSKNGDYNMEGDDDGFEMRYRPFDDVGNFHDTLARTSRTRPSNITENRIFFSSDSISHEQRARHQDFGEEERLLSKSTRKRRHYL